MVADCFEDEFVGAFATETLVGSGVKLVGLREVREESDPMSITAITRLVEESRDFLARYLPWAREATSASISKQVRGWILAEQLSQGGCWGILDNTLGTSENGPLVGFMMLDVNLKNRSAAISYWLGEKYAGKGFATQALQLLSDFSFKVLHLNRLEIFASVHNEKSAAVALRCGFSEEGVCRDFEQIDGKFVDHRRFSRLLRDK